METSNVKESHAEKKVHSSIAMRITEGRDKEREFSVILAFGKTVKYARFVDVEQI